LIEKEEEIKKLEKLFSKNCSSFDYQITNTENICFYSLSKDCSSLVLKGEAEENHTLVLTLKEDLQSNGNKYIKSKNGVLVVQTTHQGLEYEKSKKNKIISVDKKDNESSDAETASFCILDRNSCNEKYNETSLDNLNESKLMNKKRGRKKKDLCCGC
jgi:hypothetical protein